MNDDDFLKLIKEMSLEELEAKIPCLVEFTRIIVLKLKEEKEKLAQK